MAIKKETYLPTKQLKLDKSSLTVDGESHTVILSDKEIQMPGYKIRTFNLQGNYVESVDGWKHILEPNTSSRVVKITKDDQELAVAYSSGDGHLLSIIDGKLQHCVLGVDKAFNKDTREPLAFKPNRYFQNDAMVFIAGKSGMETITLSQPPFEEGMEIPIEVKEDISNDQITNQLFWRLYHLLLEFK